VQVPGRAIVVAVALVLAAPLALGQDVGLATDEPAEAEEPSDAWLSAKVKAALLTAEDVPAMRVHVDTVEGP
jgi:osmotically-inducible protein OsmY